MGFETIKPHIFMITCRVIEEERLKKGEDVSIAILRICAVAKEESHLQTTP